MNPHAPVTKSFMHPLLLSRSGEGSRKCSRNRNRSVSETASERFAKRGGGIADCIFAAPRDEAIGAHEAGTARRDSIQLREACAGVVEILADAPRIQIDTTAA